jgi:hypothetical protein
VLLILCQALLDLPQGRKLVGLQNPQRALAKIGDHLAQLGETSQAKRVH